MKITRKQLIKLIKEQLDSSLFQRHVFAQPELTSKFDPEDVTMGGRGKRLRDIGRAPYGSKYPSIKTDYDIATAGEMAEFLGYPSVKAMDDATLARHGGKLSAPDPEEQKEKDEDKLKAYVELQRALADADRGGTGARIKHRNLTPAETTGDFDLFETRIRRLIRKVLLEGGNAFEGTYEGRIPANDVKSIVLAFNVAVLNKIGLKGLPAGSTRDPSPERGAGDIDLVVDSNDKAMIREQVASILGPENVKFVGQLVCAKFPYEGLGHIQIDLIPSATPEDTQWQMSGGSATGAKGIFRNLLLAFFAKKAGEKESMERGEEGSVKYTLAWPGGLMKKEKTGEKIPTRGKNKGIPQPVYSDAFESRISNPSEFLPMIGVNLSPEQASNFESLVEASLSDEALRLYVREFAETLDPENNRIINRSPAMVSAANKVIEYIQSKI